MDRYCENKTRLVEMKGDLLVITLVPCRSCETCSPKPVQIVDLVDSDSDSEMDYSPHTRWLNGRYVHIREVIYLD